MDNSMVYEFQDTDRMTMPKNVANVIKTLMKQGETCDELEQIYQIIRDEMPTYRHKDNSNARKIITRKNIDGIIRKLPVTAYLLIIELLGIASGKFLPGRQVEMFTAFTEESLKAE